GFPRLRGGRAGLRNPSTEAEGELFPNNLLNKPLFIVNAGRDRLYPTSSVEPYINHLRHGGVELTYLPQPDGGHNIEWWPDVKDAFESFVRDHPRNPLPTRLTWETDLSEGTRRAHWLVIDALSNPPPAHPPPALHHLPTRPRPKLRRSVQRDARHLGDGGKRRRHLRAASRRSGLEGRRGSAPERRGARGSPEHARGGQAAQSRGPATWQAGRAPRQLSAHHDVAVGPDVSPVLAFRARRSRTRGQHRPRHDARCGGAHPPAL